MPGSLRHLAEVIRTYRLCPGYSMDKDDVAAVLAADLRYVTRPPMVVATAHACSLIAGVPFGDAEARRLRVACAWVQELATERAPVRGGP